MIEFKTNLVIIWWNIETKNEEKQESFMFQNKKV